MKKRSITIMIALLMISSMVLSACGGAKATPALATMAPATSAPLATTAPAAITEPVTITMWHNWGPDDAKGPAMRSILDDFMAANPDVIVKDEVYVDSDIPLKLETASAAKQEPDLVLTGGIGSAFSWPDSGVTVPVNDLITKWGFDGKFSDTALGNYSLPDGRIIAFPLEGFTWPMWYNTKVFEAINAPIPTTTDELITGAAALRAAGYDGPVVASGGDDMGGKLFELIVQSAATDAEARKCIGEGDWTTPGCVKGVELFVQLRDAGVFVDNVEGIDYAGAEALFGTGKIAMCHYGAWAFADPVMLPLNSDVQIGGFPLPAGSPHQNPVYFSAFSAKGIFVTPNGQSKLGAVEKFIKFFYEPEMIARFVEEAGMTPPLIQVPVDSSKLNPLFAQTLTMKADVVEISDGYRPAAVATDFARITQEAFAPGTTAETILADLTTAYDAIK